MWWWEWPDSELRQPGRACDAPRVGTKRPPSLPTRHRSSSAVSTEISGNSDTEEIRIQNFGYKPQKP